MSDPAAHLRTLAHRVADAYIARTQPRAILLVGSAATGDADFYSDLDLLVYYDRVPPGEAVAEASNELGAERYQGTPWSDKSGEPDQAGYGERYFLDGIECQIGHMSAGAVEREIRRLVVDRELDEELFKIISGLFEGLPLHGQEQIELWRRQAAYTEQLQRAMIEKRWKFFPSWFFQERLGARDATVWRYDVLVQSAYNIVGVLAALNRVYFSTFEFKRASRFLSQLEVAPPDLAARLEALFASDPAAATAELERLVAETGALVSARFPDLELKLEWGVHQTPPGRRESPWSPNDLNVPSAS